MYALAKLSFNSASTELADRVREGDSACTLADQDQTFLYYSGKMLSSP